MSPPRSKLPATGITTLKHRASHWIDACKRQCRGRPSVGALPTVEWVLSVDGLFSSPRLFQRTYHPKKHKFSKHPCRVYAQAPLTPAFVWSREQTARCCDECLTTTSAAVAALLLRACENFRVNGYLRQHLGGIGMLFSNLTASASFLQILFRPYRRR